VTLKTKVVGLLQYAQGDDVQTYLQRWLAQSLRQVDTLLGTTTWRGTWSSATAYAANDAVTYNGLTYVALSPVGPTATSPDLDPTHWRTLAPPVWGSP
jgi:thiamine monophosphate synthase